jgi:hypothetical protein
MVEIALPDWPGRKLERVGIADAMEVALAYDRLPGDGPVDRLVVNMLRHEFTAYDTDPTQQAHRPVCDAIAARFVWLRSECDRQVRTQSRREAEERCAAVELQAILAAEKAERHARAQEFRQAMGQFRQGMRVTAKVKGHPRDATVVKVGRSRLTIGFTIKSGADRTAVVYARDVRPV